MFIAIPVGMNYRTDRLPVVTLWLIGINTLIWLVSLLLFFPTGGDSYEWIMEHLWLIPAQANGYSWLTHMFVHAGFFHLLGNMIFLFLFGACVEDMIGRQRFAVFYIVSGLIAAITYIAMSPEHFQSEIPMGGASGAISGCMGMYLFLRAEANIEFKYCFWFFLIYFRVGEFEVPAWAAISFWFAKDLLFAVLGMFDHDSGGGVAFGAHVGGFVAGMALIGLYHWRKKPGPEVVEPPDEPVINPATLIAKINPRPAAEPAGGETPTIYLHDGEQQAGPFTLTQVQNMIRRGEVPRDASYWSEGMDDWQSVTDLAGPTG